MPRSQTNKTAYTHSTASAVDHTRQTRFTLSIAEGGRRDCRRQSNPLTAWRVRLAVICTERVHGSTHTSPGKAHNAHHAIPRAWMVYYPASITLFHSSEGEPPARCPPRQLLGCRGGRAADETEAAPARADTGCRRRLTERRQWRRGAAAARTPGAGS